MPSGWERINLKHSLPNKNIVFIKPRPGPDETTAKEFLERIAAQCLPLMNNHHLSVTSLEEYEPNREFWGRNFNNGEVIQLVLKSPSTGRWLPFKFVQMVMIHELAHNKQMNHSKAFWSVRNAFSSEMKSLWDKGYTGDGLWGKGLSLTAFAREGEQLAEDEVLPKHLCGGTFRSQSRGKKRNIKPKITCKEQQERRIKRKFGTNGVALGADEQVKVKLENKQVKNKPRVARSVRGRELRAAAALSRVENEQADDALLTDSETEGGADEDVLIKRETFDALDINGDRLLDSEGRGMVKVCEDEDKDDKDAKEELSELQSLGSDHTKPSSQHIRPWPERMEDATEIDQSTAHKKDANNHSGSCPICSMSNKPTALTCSACSNVLRPDFVPNSWRCESSICTESVYINAGDVGLCGVCGVRNRSGGHA